MADKRFRNGKRTRQDVAPPVEVTDLLELAAERDARWAEIVPFIGGADAVLLRRLRRSLRRVELDDGGGRPSDVLLAEAHFLTQLAVHRLLRGFAMLDTALRKLPRARHIHALADQEAAGRIHHQRSHIGPILNHGKNLRPAAGADNL